MQTQTQISWKTILLGNPDWPIFANSIVNDLANRSADNWFGEPKTFRALKAQWIWEDKIPDITDEVNDFDKSSGFFAEIWKMIKLLFNYNAISDKRFYWYTELSICCVERIQEKIVEGDLEEILRNFRWLVGHLYRLGQVELAAQAQDYFQRLQVYPLPSRSQNPAILDEKFLTSPGEYKSFLQRFPLYPQPSLVRGFVRFENNNILSRNDSSSSGARRNEQKLPVFRTQTVLNSAVAQTVPHGSASHTLRTDVSSTVPRVEEESVAVYLLAPQVSAEISGLVQHNILAARLVETVASDQGAEAGSAMPHISPSNAALG